MTTAAIVLAAGRASRFDGVDHKLRTPFQGRPLVTWAIDAAVSAAVFAEVFVVVGAVALGDLVPSSVTVVDNEDWAAGQASSVRAGLAAVGQAGHSAAVLGLGDSPLVPASAWAAVAAAEGQIVTATFGGRRRPPTKLEQVVWDEIPATGDEAGRALFRRWPDRVREVACEGDPIDIDTLEDLAPWN